MLNLIKRNKKYFENLNYKNINLEQKNEIINSIKNNNTIIIKGFYNILKSNLISYIITNSNYKYQYLYLNKNLDLDNILKSNNSLEFILRHLENYKEKPKIIILENIDSIKNIQDFIGFLNKNKIKSIIISNIPLKLVNEIKIIEIKENKNYNFEKIKEEDKKVEILERSNIIIEEIIKPYNIKNIDLYEYTLIFLSKLNKNSSIREINRELNKIIKVSLITMMEYLKYSEQSKIIKQIKAFDFKKNKQIETKSKYFFTDTNFRNSLYNFELNETILKQNFLFSELDKRGYEINSGINGSYDFDFYGIKNNISSLNSYSFQEQEATKSEISTIFIDFCESTDKKEIRKQINKLLKVPEIPEESNKKITQTFSKYLIVENINELGIKKTQYENLKIISFDELLKLI